MTNSEIKPCPNGHVIQDMEDFTYPVDRDRKVWSAICDHPECDWSRLGWTEQDAIDNWNTRTESIAEKDRELLERCATYLVSTPTTGAERQTDGTALLHQLQERLKDE